jgi:hypothetical protein
MFRKDLNIFFPSAQPNWVHAQATLLLLPGYTALFRRFLVSVADSADWLVHSLRRWRASFKPGSGQKQGNIPKVLVPRGQLLTCLSGL